MTAREICQALIDGKKVGSSPYRYMFLNIDGEIVVNCEEPRGHTDDEIMGSLFMWECVTVQPEDGP
jgi:hypothetical protein